ncbi:hypothetical protein ASE25_17500 [Terrabacter sp. Root85]|nr:hypothetical protein ASE25_17500 [Terrabacter sp. Root85]
MRPTPSRACCAPSPRRWPASSSSRRHASATTASTPASTLADEDLRIVLEADSHEFHSERKAFDRDCRRYNGLVTRDWLVLRFTWEQVMFEPDVVRRAIEDVVALRRSQGLRRLRTGQVTGPNRRKGR